MTTNQFIVTLVLALLVCSCCGHVQQLVENETASGPEPQNVAATKLPAAASSDANGSNTWKIEGERKPGAWPSRYERWGFRLDRSGKGAHWIQIEGTRIEEPIQVAPADVARLRAVCEEVRLDELKSFYTVNSKDWGYVIDSHVAESSIRISDHGRTKQVTMAGAGVMATAIQDLPPHPDRDPARRFLRLREAIESVIPAPEKRLRGPPVDGTVIDPARDSDRVIVSCGSSAGSKKGLVLTVTRKGRYVGDVQVLEVAADRSVCRVVRLNDGMAIQPGDTVTSTW